MSFFTTNITKSFAALAKNSQNLRGTGGGAGVDLTLAETTVLDTYDERDSNVITGIEDGYETSIVVVCYPAYVTICSIMN